MRIAKDGVFGYLWTLNLEWETPQQWMVIHDDYDKIVSEENYIISFVPRANQKQFNDPRLRSMFTNRCHINWGSARENNRSCLEVH